MGREIKPLRVEQIADRCLYAAYILTNGDNILNDVLEAGDIVRIRGLTSDRGKHYNDHYGKLISLSQTTGRWELQLSDGEAVHIKSNNLEMGENGADLNKEWEEDRAKQKEKEKEKEKEKRIEEEKAWEE